MFILDEMRKSANFLLKSTRISLYSYLYYDILKLNLYII